MSGNKRRSISHRISLGRSEISNRVYTRSRETSKRVSKSSDLSLMTDLDSWQTRLCSLIQAPSIRRRPRSIQWQVATMVLAVSTKKVPVLRINFTTTLQAKGGVLSSTSSMEETLTLLSHSTRMMRKTRAIKARHH